MQKVVLYFPETNQDRRGDAWCLPPLSLLAIAGPLVEAGCTVKIIDARLDRDSVHRVLEETRDAVCLGISVLTGHQILGGLQVANALKQEMPRKPVVWGGYHPTLLPRQTLTDPAIDAVVLGQGERTFKELVDAYTEKRPLHGIAGLFFKENGEIFENPARPFEDVNGFSPLPYYLIDLNAHFPRLEFGKRIISYVSSQGCPYPCSFCAESAAYGRRWSGLRPERVSQEIQQLTQQYQADGVIFVDNNFFVDERRVQDICSEFLRRGLKIRWAAQGRADQIASLSPKTFELLRNSNFEVFHVGAESGSIEMLDRVQKTMKRETILECAHICKQQQVRISFGFIFGFPGETEMDFQANISLMEEVTEVQGAYDCIVHYYAPCPGTPLAEEARSLGTRLPECLKDWGVFNTVRGATPWVNGQYIDKVRRRNEFYFPLAYPNSALSKLGVKNAYTRVWALPFSLISKIRWRRRYYGLPLDWYFYKFCRAIPGMISAIQRQGFYAEGHPRRN
jgi:anaerobic magnesium-protoporphyrin IX monomethyl ester cyclase